MADVLLPLFWDGSTLSIPYASPTQDGYLSKHTFVLFSGGEVVPVTSFNTRTGEVILLEDDVLAALGYTPLNKHGDTMTGPLTLQGNPTTDLHAATRAYVDAHSGLIKGEYLASAYGASGSALKFTGAITSGSKTLTLTAASDFQVGQGIFITGGLAGGNLLTKVDAVSGTTITLHDAASATRGSTNVQHDDTVALQAALNALGAASGGTLIMEPGFYRVNGPIGSFNSILKFPFVPVIDASHNATRPPCYRIIAYNVPVSPGGNLPQDVATIIQSDVANASASILASGLYNASGSASDCNTSIVSIEGVTFRTYDNPNISCLDLGVQWNVFLRNVSFDTGMAGQSNSYAGGTEPGGSQPTHGTYGLRLPRVNACTQIQTDNVTVSNYGVGVIGSELWNSRATWIHRCAIGWQSHGADANYPAIGDLLIVQCPTSIDASPGKLRLDVHVNFESESSGWWAPIGNRYLYDPSDKSSGVIRYINIAAGGGGGLASPIGVTGGTNTTLWNLALPF